MFKMSGIFVKNRCIIRNLRKSFRYFSPSYSKVRVTNPLLHLNPRHERCFAKLAYNHTENSESLSNQGSASANIESALNELDIAARRNGRVPKVLVESAFSLAVNTGEALTSIQSLYLLRSCGLMLRETPEARVQLAEKIWRELQKLGCSFEVKHYNSLLKIYVDCHHQFTPSEFLVRLESNNVEPNKVTFLYLMEKYCNDGDLNGASEILEYMKEKGFPVNENVFSTLIAGHMRIKDVSGAMEIFDVMRASNLTPTSQSYLALASGHASNGNIEGVKSAIKEAESNGIKILKEDYFYILSSISSDENLSYVDEVINQMGGGIVNLKQIVLNTAFNLIIKGASESAYHLVLSLCDDEESSRLNTNVFIKHITKTNQPIEKVLKLVNDIYDKNLNALAWLNCAKSYIDVGMLEEAFVIFKEMTNRGFPVRYHHVKLMLPVLKSEKEALLVLRRMSDLGLPAEYSTFLDVVFPFMDVSDPETVFKKIEETGQTRTYAFDALFTYYTHNGQSSNAKYLAQKYEILISSDLKMKKFLSSHSDAEKKNPNSAFYEVLSFLMENVGRHLRISSEAEGKLLADLILLNPSVFLLWARRAKEANFQVKRKSLDVCRSILSKNNPQFLHYLQKLEGDSSERKSISSFITARFKTTEDEDKEMKILEERGIDTSIYKQQLLQHHVRNKNFDRVNLLKSELEKSNVKLSPLTLNSLFNCYKQQCKIEEARKYLKTLSETYPDFEVDNGQVIEFATLLVKFSKLDDALDVLKSSVKVVRINGSKDFLNRAIRNFFDCIIELGEIDFLRNAQNHLLTVFKDRTYSSIMCEPLIKMHLFRNNIEEAVKEFKSLVHDKKIAPYAIQLLKKCIVSDDHQMLQTVIETASLLEGKVSVLQDLSLAFFELGRKEQAAQVLQNLGRKVQPSFVLNICSRLHGDKAVLKLEDFLSLLRRVDGVDLSKGYSFLFKLYDFDNDAERALSMYNEVKHLGLNDSTKRILVNLLTRMKADIPSELQGNFESSENETKVQNEDVETLVKPTDPIMVEFHEVLEKGAATLALEKLDSLKKGHIRSLSLGDMTKLVGLIVENKLGLDLQRNVQAMSYIIDNANEVLRPLLSKYGETGDLESLHHIASFIPDFSLKSIAFNGFMCKAYLASGKPAELLEEMENKFNKKNKIFSSTSFIQLLQHPDLKERATNLAERYYEAKFYSPMIMVWANHLINGNYEAADKIEENHKIEGDHADSILLKSIRQNRNVTLGWKYISNLNKYHSRTRHKERAYGTLLDVLVLNEMHDEAVNLVVEAKQKGLYLEKVFRSTLVTLKAALERENKPVPFTIPSEDFMMPE